MAIEIGKETFQIGSDGRMRLRVQWLADSRIEAMTGIDTVKDGLGFTGTSGTPFINASGKYVVDANYEGLINEPNETQDHYEIVGEDREVKIEEFPDRELLKEELGAYEEDGKLKFPEKLPKATGIGSGLSLDSYRDAGTEEDNVMFNVTSYPVEYELATWRMVRKKVPQRVVKMARTVVKKLPAGFEYSGDASAWYVRPLSRRKIGSMWEITVQFQEINEVKSLLKLKQLMENKVRKKSALDTFFN